MAERQNKVKKYRKPLNLNIGMLIFGAIFIYVIICVIMYFQTDHIVRYEVTEGSLATNNIYRGIAIRKEEVVNTDTAGYVNFYAREGERVAKGDTVYIVDETGRLSQELEDASLGENTLSNQELSEFRNEIVNFMHGYDDVTYESTYDFKYSLKILFRNKSLIFWTFIFPIILGTFFKLAFNDIENNEAFHPFDIAVVESNDFNNNKIFKDAIKSVSKDNDNKLFNVKYVSKSDANKLLEDKKVTGYLEFIGNDVNIKINDNGIYETILKFFVDEVNSEKNMINLSINEEVSKGNYDIDGITSNILDKLNSEVNIKNIS